VSAAFSIIPGDDSPYIPNRSASHIHAMDDAEAIESELTWLAALNQEAGLPVSVPLSPYFSNLHHWTLKK